MNVSFKKKKKKKQSGHRPPVQRASLPLFLLCDRLPEPRRLFMVQQTHNRKEIRLRKKKTQEEAPYTAARRSAFPSVPIKLFRRPPACRFMGGEGLRGRERSGWQRHVLSCTKTGDGDF